MTAEAHALLTSLDGILAECELVKSHLAIAGAAHAARNAHADLMSRLEAFRVDLARALEPKAEPVVMPAGVPFDVVVSTKSFADITPAMWSARPDAESAPVAAEAVADSPADDAE